MGLTSIAFKLAVPPLPLDSGKDVRAKRQMPTAVQVKCKAIHEPQRLKLSRRDAMVCFTSSLTATVLPTDPANARIMNADIMQNIMEKLEKLSELAGISKPKADSSSGGQVMKPPVPLNDRPKDKNEKSQEKGGNSKHEPKKAEKPQEKTENPKPKVAVNNGNEKPPAPQNGPPTEAPVEAKSPQ